MVNFALGIYVFGFIISFLLYYFLEMLGGKHKSRITVLAAAFTFAVFWPATIWFIGKR